MSEKFKSYIKPSMVTLTSLVFATVQFSFESKLCINLTFFPFSYIWCTICSLADNPELPHLSYLFACKDALVLARMPLNVGLNYVKEKSSGCLVLFALITSSRWEIIFSYVHASSSR